MRRNLNIGLNSFKNCTFKVKRLSDSYRNVDFSEYLISKRKQTVFTIYTANNDTASFGATPELDFKFYEICTINIIVQLGTIDVDRRSEYMNNLRDTLRIEYKFNTMIFISYSRPTRRSWFDKFFPTRIFYLFLIRPNTAIWCYFCPFCRGFFIGMLPAEVTLLTFQYRWLSDITFSTDVQPSLMNCLIKTVLLKDCSPRAHIVDTVTSNLNITLVPASAEYVQIHEFGYIMFNTLLIERLPTTHRFPSKAINPRISGVDLVYCKYDLSSELISFKALLIPLSPSVWFWFCVTCVAIGVLGCVEGYSLRKIHVNTTYPNFIWDYCYNAIAALMKQSAHFNFLIFLILSFASVILLAFYEFFITSELIVPSIYEPFKTLREFVDNDFKIMFTLSLNTSDDVYLNNLARSVLYDDFKREKLLHRLNDTVFDAYSKNPLKTLAKKNLNFAISAKVQEGVDILEDLDNSDGRTCYAVRNVLRTWVQFDWIDMVLANEVKKTFQGIIDAGLVDLWTKWETYFVYERRMRKEEAEKSEKDGFISFNNLISTFVIYCVMIIISLIEGVYECRGNVRKMFVVGWTKLVYGLIFLKNGIFGTFSLFARCVVLLCRTFRFARPI
ncbi:hypothetical protein Fcan01_23844 [Folsomia candida]|uniref:Uncharacterized protein n=1 Tax=Folsomia candida TaxID=158441 RepID=A0A226D9H4_FOLCA|nr:hypothetical protein Fcan01_23844 [Folsomia candida]